MRPFIHLLIAAFVLTSSTSAIARASTENSHQAPTTSAAKPASGVLDFSAWDDVEGAAFQVLELHQENGASNDATASALIVLVHNTCLPAITRWSAGVTTEGAHARLVSQQLSAFTSVNPRAGWTRVARWVDPHEAALWRGRGTLLSPSAGSGLPPRTFMTLPGAAKPGGTGGTLLQFDVPTAALQPGGSPLWRVIFNEGRAVPIRDLVIQ